MASCLHAHIAVVVCCDTSGAFVSEVNMCTEHTYTACMNRKCYI